MNISKEELLNIIEQAVAAGVERAMKPAQLAKKKFLNVTEAVEYLASIGFHTSVNGIYTMVSREKLPTAKINGKLAFERHVLDSLMLAKTHKSDPDEARAAIVKSISRRH